MSLHLSGIGIQRHRDVGYLIREYFVWHYSETKIQLLENVLGYLEEREKKMLRGEQKNNQNVPPSPPLSCAASSDAHFLWEVIYWCISKEVNGPLLLKMTFSRVQIILTEEDCMSQYNLWNLQMLYNFSQ